MALFNSPKCGCAICNAVPRGNDKSVNALSAESGTAYEAALTDSSPTNGTNPFIDSLIWGGVGSALAILKTPLNQL
jgi:hypothetical protein